MHDIVLYSKFKIEVNIPSMNMYAIQFYDILKMLSNNYPDEQFKETP